MDADSCMTCEPTPAPAERTLIGPNDVVPSSPTDAATDGFELPRPFTEPPAVDRLDLSPETESDIPDPFLMEPGDRTEPFRRPRDAVQESRPPQLPRPRDALDDSDPRLPQSPAMPDPDLDRDSDSEPLEDMDLFEDRGDDTKDDADEGGLPDDDLFVPENSGMSLRFLPDRDVPPVVRASYEAPQNSRPLRSAGNTARSLSRRRSPSNVEVIEVPEVPPELEPERLRAMMRQFQVDREKPLPEQLQSNEGHEYP